MSWDRAESPMGTGNFPAAGSKLANFEPDILRDPETPSVVRANAYCWHFALNLPFVCFPLQIFLVLLRDYVGTSKNPADSHNVLTCPQLFCRESVKNLRQSTYEYSSKNEFLPCACSDLLHLTQEAQALKCK